MLKDIKTFCLGCALRPSLRWLVLLIFWSASTSASSQQYLEHMLADESLPGIVWATIDGHQQLSGGNGFAVLENGLPMTADTKVHVGSVTKILVALGVLRLVSTGHLTLDADVEYLLPELNWKNPWRDTAPITVRSLLEHTAGLDNIRMWQFLNSKVTADTPLKKAFPHSQERLLQVRTRPGRQYSYSNMGYALLGMVIEKVTQERYEDVLNRQVLAPLGMNSSSFRFFTQTQDSRLAMGYLDGGVEQSAVPMYLRPAGQFTTTANDMGRLLRFLLSGGRIDDARFIQPELMASLGTPSTTIAYQSGLQIGHGLALALRDRHGVLGECHPGTTFGFRAYLCLFPDEEKGFFYAINADDEVADYERFNEYFIKSLSVSPQVSSKPKPGEDVAQYAGLYTLAPSNMEQFAWLDWMFNSLWVKNDADGIGLVVHSLQAPERLLLPLGDELFRDSQRNLASHVFYREEGTVLSNGLITWRRTSPVSLGLSWLSLSLGVLGLIYIFVRGGWLLASRQISKAGGLLMPWLCLVSFVLPVFLFTRQSFIEFGEVTAASMLLAALSGLLPLLLVVGLVQVVRNSQRLALDVLALFASAQFCALLLSQKVLPFMSWG